MEHRNGPPSPISPIDQTSIPMVPLSTQAFAQTSNSAGAQTVSPVTPTQQSSAATAQVDRPSSSFSNAARTDWLPFTLRLYFLPLPLFVALGLTIAIALLCWYSSHHNGLGKDDGSSAILFGWRFTPTLVAVLYTQVTVILFEDVKRTEPFARLAKPGGAKAYGTLLQTPKAWWAILLDLTWRRKKAGKTSWALICSTIINILALLAISPLSSALLASEEVVVPQTIAFTRFAPKNDTQIPMNATRETFFRTMSGLTRNITTSAWVSNTSLTMPFWPTTENAQLGPDLVSPHSSWQAETATFSSDFECQNMTLEKAEIEMKAYTAPDWHGYLFNGTQPMVSFVLTSSDGCRYELDVHPAVDLAYLGGVMWSDAATYQVLTNGILNVDRFTIDANVSSTSPYARLNTSKECNNRDIIIASTPWTSQLMLYDAQPLFSNRTYQRSPNFQMRALLCDSHYSMTKRSIAASMSLGSQTLLENAPGTIGDQQKIPQSLMNLTRFQDLSLSDQWKNYVDNPSLGEDAQVQEPDPHDSTSEPRKQPQTPGFSGPGVMLGTFSSWNVSRIVADPSLPQQAASVKGRLLMEILRDSVSQSTLMQTEDVQGKVSTVETRVIVLQEIGITLSVLFFLSLCLLSVVFWSSRLSRRPLNLPSDPGSTVGMSILLDPRLTSMATLRRLHSAPGNSIRTALRSETFFTTNSTLYEDMGTSASRTAASATKSKKRRDWRPRAIHLKSLVALGIFLALVLTALLVLNSFSSRSQLYQKAFTYQADLSKFGLSLSTFAPISIAPTIVSIIVTLWWDQIDMTFRLLQPYISMSRSPTPIASGAGLTYRSKTWIGAAGKAARNRHWVLFTIAVGSTLCQVLTVSMSALFERRADNVVSQVTLNRTLEARQAPVINLIGANAFEDPSYHAYRVLDNLYRDNSNNWLYNAAIQLSLNGPQVSWSQGEWNFVPVELSEVPGTPLASFPDDAGSGSSYVASTNVSLRTSAMRAWLDCQQIDSIANQSSWLVDLPIKDLPSSANVTGLPDGYALAQLMFGNTSTSTTVLGDSNIAQCCANGTTSDPQKAAIGYWSPLLAKKNEHDFPYTNRQWPLSFVTKWIVGKPRTFYDPYMKVNYLYYEEPPKLQAAQCWPVIDVADATVTLDKETGTVYSYELQGSPRPVDAAWSEVFVRHEISDPTKHFNRNYSGKFNMTTSFGILFLDSMLGASDRAPPNGDAMNGGFEILGDNAYNFRDQDNGLDTDLMSYSMYALAGKDPDALLDYTTLITHANRTFQTFFQQFVRKNLSTAEGGWAYQKIGDTSMDGLGRAVDENGTAIVQREYTVPNGNRTVTASVSNRLQVLYMNPVATYLSTAIVVWLIGTTAVITCLQRKYTGSMLRNVELIADVLVLVAGSDNFLALVQEKGLNLKKDQNIKTRLGWFKGRDGEVRWGVEVVGGRNAVEWVDAPRKDFV